MPIVTNRYKIQFIDFPIIAVLAYVLIFITGCGQFSIEGGKNMPFRDLTEEEFSNTEFVNVKKHGAKGDGTNDDTSAIQSAINCALVGGIKKVFLPPGTYKTTSALAITGGVHLIGAGKNITEIMVTGGGDGIGVIRGGSVGIWEGTRLSDFRIYSTTTPVAGAGISIAGDRSVDVDNVHIGGWYAGTTGGFIYGVYVTDQPAYYTTVRRCALFRNTYGVYINSGANESRIIDSEIWWGDYGVYLKAPQAQVRGNSIECYTTAGVVSCAEEHIIDNNRFESVGVTSVILNPGASMCSITNSHGQTGLGDNGPVINLSGKNNHRIGNSFIPIGENATNLGYPAGQITGGDITNWHQSNVHIEANVGDLTLRVPKNTVNPNSVVVESNLDVSSPILSSPGIYTGTSAENLIPVSEGSLRWSSSIVAGTVYVEDNAAIGADGYTVNAMRVLSSGGSENYIGSYIGTPIKGQMYQFSIWLRGDNEHNVQFLIWEDNNPLQAQWFTVGTDWKRYSTYATCDADGQTYFRILIKLADGYPLYTCGAQFARMKSLNGTDNSGVNAKSKVMDSTVNFSSAGIDIGGVACIHQGYVYNVYGSITEIRSTLHFDTGAGLAPAVGDTVTGGTSTASGVITDVVITSGTFEGNNAVGYLEINPMLGYFAAESITWTNGSCNCTDVNLNDVLCFNELFQGHGSKTSVDNADTYTVCSSAELGLKPYIVTTEYTYDIMASTSPVLVAPKIYTNDTIFARKGYTRNVKIWNPFDSDGVTAQGVEYFYCNVTGDNRTLYVHNGSEGDVFTVVNTTATDYGLLVFHYSGGVSQWVYGGEETTWVFIGGAWRVVSVRQSGLAKNSDITLNSLTAKNKVIGKTINGAVKPLTNEATIACDMNDGNVFTLSTTDVIGAVTINASNGTAGQTIIFIITDDSTGGHVVTFGTNFKSKGTLTGTTDKTATISFVYDGTSFYEVSRTTGL